MARWIAFDEESTAVAAAQSGMAVSFQRGDALETALASSRPALVLLPGQSSEDVTLVELSFNAPATPRVAPPRPQPLGDEPVAYEASGFLGLSDDPVFEEEAPVRKKWWQRLLD